MANHPAIPSKPAYNQELFSFLLSFMNPESGYVCSPMRSHSLNYDVALHVKMENVYMISATKEKELTEKETVDKTRVKKILSSVSDEKGFHFYIDVGKKTGETALNLSGFYEGLRVIEPQSIRFHFQRKDFQKWIKDVLGDQSWLGV